MRKSVLFAILAVLFAACNTNEPAKAFIGTWEPVGYETYDTFVITSDSIKAIKCDTKEEHYQAHYKVLRDSVIELERCWLERQYKNAGPSDWNPEEYFFTEAKMYIDGEGCLVIEPFDYGSLLVEIKPNYAILKLKKRT